MAPQKGPTKLSCSKPCILQMLSPERGVKEQVLYLPCHHLQVTKLLMKWESLWGSFLAHEEKKPGARIQGSRDSRDRAVGSEVSTGAWQAREWQSLDEDELMLPPRVEHPP